MSSFESKIPKPVNDVTQSPFANKKPEPLLPDIMEEEKLSAEKDNDAERQQFSNEPGAEQKPEQHALAEENAETDPVEKRKLQLQAWAKEDEATNPTVQRILQLQAWAKESEATNPTVQRMLQLQAWAKEDEATNPTLLRKLELQEWALEQEATNPTVLRKLELQKRFSLSVSQPDDSKELEADKKSEEVTSPLTPLLRGEGNDAGFEDTVEDKEKLSAKSAGSGGELSVDAATKDYINNLSGGEPMRKQDQQFFGERFGADFSNVRIHTDSTAAESAKDINARAYTKENNIVFGKGQYQPDSAEGKKLYAHELAHVEQQDKGKLPRNKIQRHPAIHTALRLLQALGPVLRRVGLEIVRVFIVYGPRAWAYLSRVTPEVMQKVWFILRQSRIMQTMLINAQKLYKSTQFTEVGRALTKHPNIVGLGQTSELIKLYGNNQGINKAALDALKNIIQNGDMTVKTTKAFGLVIEFKLPSGLGARFSAKTYEFIGFLGRGIN